MRFFVFFLLAALFAGCSGSSGSGDSGRIAAVVNGVEITQREVDFLYQRSAVAGASDAAALNQRRNILSGLVRAELLAQQGAKMGLDKSPEYLLGLHDAQRRVLAGLAQEKMASLPSDQVSPALVEQVIAGNPNLFSGRRLLVYDEVLISGVDAALLQSLNAYALKGASLGALLEVVKSSGIGFERSMKTLASDQIQPAFLKVLSGSKPKVPVVIRVEDKFLMILMLHTIVPVPIEGSAATVKAANLIQEKQRNAALYKKLTSVLDTSEITYFGEFKVDSAGVKNGMALLPSADPARVAGVMTHRIRLAVSLGVSIMGAVLLLFISKSILTGSVWEFPFIPRDRKNNNALSFDYDAFQVPPGVKFIVFIVVALAVAAMVFQFVLIWGDVPFWMMGLAVPGGLLFGIGLSRVFAMPSIQPLTIMMRWFLLGGFALIVVVALLVTRRIIFY